MRLLELAAHAESLGKAAPMVRALTEASGIGAAA
jgi:hypothetical protein